MPDAPGTRNVRIEPSIREYMKILKASPERLDLAVRKRFREAAAEIRDDARGAARANRPDPSKVRSITTERRPKVAGRQHWDQLVNSITSGSQSDRPTVSIGSERVPWALGFEFGSLGGPHKNQFPAWLGNGLDAGHFFYPAVRRNTDAMIAKMVDIMNEAFAEAFPN